MKRLELLIPPPLVMLLVGLMMWMLPRVFPALTLDWLHSTVTASAVALFGVVISLVSMVAFTRARTTMDPKHPASASNLISTGIYRYSRNPMYLASLTNLKVDIAQGMADIEAGRVDDLNMERIRQQGRAILAKCKKK